MKKLNKKKIGILIVLLLIIIIEIKAFTDSGANKLLEITAIINDNSEYLQSIEIPLEASNEGKAGYAITLPNIVDEKVVNKYIIDKKNIEEETTTEKQEKSAGEKIYLTDEEVSQKKIDLNVEYDKKEKNNQILYNKIIGIFPNKKENETNTNETIKNKDLQITIKGYMPQDAILKVEEVQNGAISENTKKYLNEKTTLDIAYDIKIIYNEKEYEPKDFDENVEVIFTNLDGQDNNKKYKVIHIDKENETEEINNVEYKNNEIRFNTNSFSVYAVLSEGQDNSTVASEGTSQDLQIQNTSPENKLISPMAAIINSGTPWDGTAERELIGEGTREFPYLIADGKDLACLRDKVNSGNTYEGKYFQIANDIVLGGLDWTPIGTGEKSFRGILNGAGHTIANARINVNQIPNGSYVSYGIFASIGGGDTKSVIKNLELSNINVEITAGGDSGSVDEGSWFQAGSLDQNPGGLHIGTLVGSLYKNANIENVIVKNSVIQDTSVINIIDYTFHLSVGGVIGYVSNSYENDTDPGQNARYLVNNCYSAVEIVLDATAVEGTVNGGFFGSDTDYNGYGSYYTGGIIGTIKNQPVWPTNSLYSGQINSNGFIGPVFGSVSGSGEYNTFGTFSNLWNGNSAGNVTINNMYFTNYRAKNRSFTTSVTSGNSTQRISNSQNNIGYVQGVNKGSYTTNMNQMLNTFNNNVTTDNEYLTWVYQDGTFSFNEKITSTAIENPEYTFTVIINDPEQTGNYNINWYKNYIEEPSQEGSLTYTGHEIYGDDEIWSVVIFDGEYYTVAKFTIEGLGVKIVFDINNNTDSVVARLEGRGLEITTVEDFKFQWYKIDLTQTEEKIEGATSLTLSGLEDGVTYKLVATNDTFPAMNTENSFDYGDRTVIYVKYNGGNNRNNGLTPQTPVQSLSTAYGKLDRNGTRNSNVIVLMDMYRSNDDFQNENSNIYNRPVTITGKYEENDYTSNNAGLYINSGNGWGGTIYKFFNADTSFQYVTWYGEGEELYLLAQGYSVTIGEGVKMTNYPNANSNQGLLGGNAPAVHLFAGWLQYNERTLPRNNSKIVIKSGTFGRLVGGGTPGTSSGQGQTTSHDFMGSSKEDSFNVEITVDIKNSTKGNYDYDINLLTGGSAAGNNYSNVIQNIKSRKCRPSNWRKYRRLSIKTKKLEISGKHIFRNINNKYNRWNSR